jgi:DNA-binding NtrC family response regulator
MRGTRFPPDTSGTMSARRHVLLVEDDEMITSMLQDFFDDAFEVSCARTAQQALARIAGNPVDMVLLDFHLADGSGQRVAEYFTGVSVPVIWMTGDPDGARKVLNSSHVLLAKPFSLSRLHETLTEALALR